jgi:DNA polymerase-3 subunit beta
MLFECQRSTLLKSIQSVIGSVNTKNSLPILTNILVNLTVDSLRMTATDLQTELVSTTDCVVNDITVIAEGDITIPAKRFLDIVRAFPEAVIKFELKDDKVILKCGRSKFTLTTLPACDYPNYRPLENPKQISVGEGLLKSAMKSIVHCAAKDDVRYYMNGMNLEFIKEVGLHVTCTDGHRLAIERLECEVAEAGTITIPIDATNELLKLLTYSESEVLIQYTDNSFCVDKSDVRLTTKLVDGKFPDVKRVIPPSSSKVAMVNRLDFMAAVKRTQLVLSEKTQGLEFEFGNDDESNVIRIAGKNNDNSAEDMIEVNNYHGGPITIGMNHRYLVDALNSLDTELVKVGMNDAQSTMLIEPTEGTGQRVIMPMRL